MPTVEADRTGHDGYARPDELVDIADIRGLLGVGKARAFQLSRDRSFPEPWLDHPQLRLWLRRQVADWIDRWRPGRAAELDVEQPGWRDTPNRPV